MTELLISLGKVLFIILVVLVFLPILIYLERKASAFIQDRTGPNRAAIGGVRLAGMVHVVADVVKLLMKEMMVPPHVNRLYFMLAPLIGWTVIALGFAVIPWADTLVLGGKQIAMQISGLNAGILYILAITSLHVYGIVLAGWASNNKFALLGGLRSTAQMISYEIPLGLALVGVFMTFGTVQLNDIVRQQGDLLFGFLPRWGVFVQPLGCMLFIVAAFAEANRNPFDLPESESELVAGFHTEYSGIRFALFYMAEYAGMILSGAMIATLFFGGWQIPYLPTEALIRHADTLLRILLLGGGLGAGLFGIVLFAWGRRMRGRFFGDARETEGAKLGTVFVLIAAALGFFFFKAMGTHVSANGAAWVALGAQVLTFLAKWMFFCFLFIWVRWSLPRFRYDQLMRLGWKSMIPLAFANIFLTAIIILLIDRVV